MHCNPLYKGEAREQQPEPEPQVRDIASSPVAKGAESWHKRLASTSPARSASHVAAYPQAAAATCPCM